MAEGPTSFSTQIVRKGADRKGLGAVIAANGCKCQKSNIRTEPPWRSPLGFVQTITLSKIPRFLHKNRCDRAHSPYWVRPLTNITRNLPLFLRHSFPLALRRVIGLGFHD